MLTLYGFDPIILILRLTQRYETIAVVAFEDICSSVSIDTFVPERLLLF